MFFKGLLKNEKLLWFLLIATQLFFLSYALVHQQTKTADSDEYIYQAQNIVDYGVIYSGDYTTEPKDPSLYSRRTPGYPGFLILTTVLFNSDYFALFVQCILSILNIFLGYKIAKRILSDTSKSYLYLLFFLFFPSQFIYATVFMSEILFQTAILGCVYFLLKFESEDKYKYFFICHVLLAVAYLIKPIAIFLWLGYMLYSIIYHNKQGIAVRQIIMTLFHLLIIGGFFLKNYRQTGVAEYSGIGRKLLINYNIPALLTFYEDETYAKNRIDSLQSNISQQTYSGQCANIDSFIKTEIFTHPIQFVAIQSYGIIRFFLETGRWDLELWRKGYQQLENTPSLKQEYATKGIKGVLQNIHRGNYFFGIYYILVVLTAISLFILFIKSLFNSTILRRHKLLLVSTILYFALLTGPSASARFRVPIFPILVILAITGFQKENRVSLFSKNE
jgi:4-amino-4-deoxy-L-arabinose transferase-like glycosyltransferase